MRVRERVRHFARDLERVVERELLLADEAVAEGLPFHERHHVVQVPPASPGVEQRQDVGMRQLRGGLDLAQEAVEAEAGRQFGAENLERDVAVVPEIAGKVDGRHPAGAEFALDAVAIGQGGRECLGSGGHFRKYAAVSVGAPRRSGRGDGMTPGGRIYRDTLPPTRCSFGGSPPSNHRTN